MPLVLRGGVVAGKVVSAKDIEALADLPPREVMLAQMAGMLQAPLVKTAGLLQALPRNAAYGLAALRIGYGFAHHETLAELNKARSPFNTSSVAQVAAIAALDDQEYVDRYVALNRVERAYFSEAAAALGLAAEWTGGAA